MHDRADDNPGVLAPPPLIYLGLIAAGIITDSFWPLPLPRLPLHPVPGVSLVLAGFVLSGWSVLEFVRRGTHPDPRHPTTMVITSGPFRFSRNPIYVAFGLMHVGVGVWIASWWVLASVIPALAVIRYGVIAAEERYLEEKFGETYLGYRNTVRRWL